MADKRKSGGKKGKGQAARRAGPPSRPIVNSKQMQQMTAIDATQMRQCLLCEKPTRSRGVFVPEDPEVLGMGEPEVGRTRTVMYPLCEHCHEMPDFPQQAEAKILAEIGRGAVPPPERASGWVKRRTN